MLPLIVGNWKMNKTRPEAGELAGMLARELNGIVTAEVVVCPPFTALETVAEALRGTNLRLGAQNMHWEPSGAFTGEISPLFLKELGCTYVILGHSERRQLFGETDETVGRKLRRALATGLWPIVCFGETLAERKAGETQSRLKAQFENSIGNTQPQAPNTQYLTPSALTIAYEPIWAIGTGEAATPEQAADVHSFLRGLAAAHFGKTWVDEMRILYGGSVTPDNTDELMAQPQINGVLVGGCSLKGDFVRIARSTL